MAIDRETIEKATFPSKKLYGCTVSPGIYPVLSTNKLCLQTLVL